MTLPPTPAEDRIALSGHPSSYTAALETRARALAADKMGLINDPDGDRVPAELWRQCLPQARADLPMGSHYEAEDVVNDPRVLATYAAAEWSELGDDGKAWTTKLVEVAQERALSRSAAGDAALADVERLLENWKRAIIDNRTCVLSSAGLDAVKSELDMALAAQAATIATLRAQLDTERREGERLRKLVEVSEELRALSERATQGPWTTAPMSMDLRAGCYTVAMANRTILKISGGAGSWAAGRKWRDENPGAPLDLLFTDTLCEDQDTYRFLIAGAANLLDVDLPAGFLPEIKDFPAWEDRVAYKAFVIGLAARTMMLMPGFYWLSDGRDVWDVFEHERFLGNSRTDPCSKFLKRTVADRWLVESCDPARTVVLVGLGPEEDERFLGNARFGRSGLAARMATLGWDFRAPLVSGITSWFPHRVEAEVERAGLWVQRLYGMGFAHANCGGACCKAGIGHWRRMMEQFPERYAWVERREAEMRDLLGDVSMLTDRRGGAGKKPLTLAALRTRDLTPPEAVEMGACRCATGDDPDLEEDYEA